MWELLRLITNRLLYEEKIGEIWTFKNRIVPNNIRSNF
ncbi:hypothetical protein LEP1GSC071_0415 [Leptospira santarosai str. JET]|uniref:Uncharacterized protein n=1 Tax=Leptospira santarosai serovar Arenal str. MAVJ 401 TaxID=1049976 RepID=M6K6L4_9LEPT|nr:hypothetical protein LEP1GSC071_0415 [Leptospira santarosai str. JET]EMN23352.1 hypothetical protein LEP1GSC063_1091 [Leptospira santarosai serovar Arenal str. MAVJ 401]